MLRGLKEKRFLLDGELIIPVGDALTFEALQLRLHPAESRVRKLSARNPRRADGVRPARARRQDPCRRAALEAAARRSNNSSRRNPRAGLHALADDRPTAKSALGWLERSGGALDGVIAKRADLEYRSGRAGDDQGQAAAHRRLRRRRLPLRREGSRKSARCCSASTTTRACSTTSASPRRSRPKERPELTEKLEKLIEPPASPATRPAARAAGAPSARPVAAAEAHAGRRSALRPGDRPALPPRHRLPALAARQGPQAMHVRPARARTSAVRAQASCSAHEPAVRRAADRGPSTIAEDVISAAEGAGAARAARRRSISRRSASTAGSATARRRASAGATISTTPASRRPSRFPIGCCRCARRRRLSPGCEPDDFVHVLLARYDPGAGIGWHRDRDVFDKVVGISLNTPATLRFRQRTATGFSAPTSRSRRARPICCPAKRATIGSTASRPGEQPALLDHLPDPVRQGRRNAAGSAHLVSRQGTRRPSAPRSAR